MQKLPKWSMLLVVAASMMALGACSRGGTAATSGSPAPSTSTSTATSSTAAAIAQWASGATATSNYGSEAGSSWNASNAIGMPEVTTCGDNGKAWASMNKNTVETITLKYSTPVTPSAIKIYESYNPGYVTSVTVSGGGKSANVYTAKPAATAGCPTSLPITVTAAQFKVDSVAVTVDQSALNNWAEIDAVQLTGTP